MEAPRSARCLLRDLPLLSPWRRRPPSAWCNMGRPGHVKNRGRSSRPMARANLSCQIILVYRPPVVPRDPNPRDTKLVYRLNTGGPNETIAVRASVRVLLSESIDRNLREWHGLYLSQNWPGRSHSNERIDGALVPREVPRARRGRANVRGVEHHHRASGNPPSGPRSTYSQRS